MMKSNFVLICAVLIGTILIIGCTENNGNSDSAGTDGIDTGTDGDADGIFSRRRSRKFRFWRAGTET